LRDIALSFLEGTVRGIIVPVLVSDDSVVS